MNVFVLRPWWQVNLTTLPLSHVQSRTVSRPAVSGFRFSTARPGPGHHGVWRSGLRRSDGVIR